MVDMTVAEPGELSQDDLDSAEALVRAAFGDGFRSHDWLHGVDGVHVLLTEAGRLLAHASVVTRTLRHDGETFTTGYVESVAVRNDQQGRGLGRAVMCHVEVIIKAEHQLGALNAVESAAGFYAARAGDHGRAHPSGHAPRCGRHLRLRRSNLRIAGGQLNRSILGVIAVDLRLALRRSLVTAAQHLVH